MSNQAYLLAEALQENWDMTIDFLIDQKATSDVRKSPVLELALSRRYDHVVEEVLKSRINHLDNLSQYTFLGRRVGSEVFIYALQNQHWTALTKLDQIDDYSKLGRCQIIANREIIRYLQQQHESLSKDGLYYSFFYLSEGEHGYQLSRDRIEDRCEVLFELEARPWSIVQALQEGNIDVYLDLNFGVLLEEGRLHNCQDLRSLEFGPHGPPGPRGPSCACFGT